MARYTLLPALFSRSLGIPLPARLCLLGVSALHIVGAFAFGFFSPWTLILPPAGFAVPLAFLGGLSLLWAPSVLVGFLAITYGLACTAFLAIAASILGDRHGADLLFAVPGLLCLVIALMLGYAWICLRRRTRVPPPPEPLDKPLENRPGLPTGTIPLAAAAAAIIAVALYILSRPREPSPMRIEPHAGGGPPMPRSGDSARPSPGFRDSIPEAESPAATFLDQERAALGENRYRDLARWIGDARSDEPWPGNVLHGRHYFLPGTFADGDSASRLGCRKALLARFNTELFRSARIDTQGNRRIYTYWRTLARDTLMAALDCRDIPTDAQYYALRFYPGGTLAVWRPIDPGYDISLDPEETDCQGNLLIALRIHQAEAQTGPEALIMATRDPIPDSPFPYAAPAPVRRDAAPRSAGPAAAPEGYEGTGFRSCWIEDRKETTGKSDEARAVRIRSGLFCEALSGSVLRLGTSMHPGPPDADGLPVWTVRMADFDRDGHTDILVQCRHFGTRIYFLDGDRIRDSVKVEPDLTRSHGC